VVVVNGDTGHVALVAGDHCGFLSCWDLGAHIVSGSTVKVIVAPLEECILSKDLANLMVAHMELGLRLKHVGWGSHYFW